LNFRTLTDRLFELPEELVTAVVGAERSFLEQHADLLAARAAEDRILDAHGDLRPEHVHLGPPLRLVDRLEFNERLRWLDPFDELSLLGMECERLGAAWIARRLVEGLAARLRDRPPDLLLSFYACHRAAMRARLSIEHLRDPNPRTPERWPKQACEYLDLAVRHSRGWFNRREAAR
jgi:aminoglycoside phosphotransferase family enzyme